MLQSKRMREYLHWQELSCRSLIIYKACSPSNVASHVNPKIDNKARRAIMLKGSSSTIRILLQHCFFLRSFNIFTWEELITTGVLFSSKSLTDISFSLFSRINSNVDPFPNSDVTSIPFELSGPNFLANLLLWCSPIPVPDLLRSFVCSRVVNSLNKFFWSSFLIPKPVSIMLILTASFSLI